LRWAFAAGLQRATRSTHLVGVQHRPVRVAGKIPYITHGDKKFGDSELVMRYLTNTYLSNPGEEGEEEEEEEAAQGEGQGEGCAGVWCGATSPRRRNRKARHTPKCDVEPTVVFIFIVIA